MCAVYLRQKNYTEALSISDRAVSIARETERKVDLYVALTNLGYSQFGHTSGRFLIQDASVA
jgi:hypothetical protein